MFAENRSSSALVGSKYFFRILIQSSEKTVENSEKNKKTNAAGEKRLVRGV